MTCNVEGTGDFARLALAFNSMMADMNKAMRQFFSAAGLVCNPVGIVQSTTSPDLPDAPGKEILVGFGHNAVLGVADKVIEAVKGGRSSISS